jgi:hypothetical protein
MKRQACVGTCGVSAPECPVLSRLNSGLGGWQPGACQGGQQGIGEHEWPKLIVLWSGQSWLPGAWQGGQRGAGEHEWPKLIVLCRVIRRAAISARLTAPHKMKPTAAPTWSQGTHRPFCARHTRPLPH